MNHTIRGAIAATLMCGAMLAPAQQSTTTGSSKARRTAPVKAAGPSVSERLQTMQDSIQLQRKLTRNRLPATEELDSLALAGSPSYVDQALRTLRRLLRKAMEWKVVAVAPTVKVMKEVGRELTIDPETEAKLLAVAKQPMKDVLIMIQDTGMRPDEVFRIRVENIDWSRRLIFNPNGKTKAARRHVPISEQLLDLLMVRRSEKREGWLFPSRRAKGGHLTTVAKQFRDARTKTGLPKSLVLYCARHTFGTAVYGATGNLAMVMKVMGHTDPRTAMHYQHPTLDPVREAIDQRNLSHKPRHIELRV